MSLCDDLNEDQVLLEKLRQWIDHWEDLEGGVRRGHLRDELKKIIYTDWVRVSEVQEWVRGLKEENKRLRELLASTNKRG